MTNIKPFDMNPLSKYEQYLLTDEWKKKHDQRLEIDGYTCQMCGSRGTMLNPLQIHHLTYHNIYHEDVDKDLVTLCKACHYGIHKAMERITNSKTGQRGWKDKLSYSAHVVDSYMEDLRLILKEGEKE